MLCEKSYTFLIMTFLYAKSIHIIFVVSWFAGLLYMVRLFIYFAEAQKKQQNVREILQTQYKLMSKRLWYIITWPSAVITGLSAIVMLSQHPELLKQPWMHVKLGLVFILYLYHFKCHAIYKRMQNDTLTLSPIKLRIWNEVATLLLFAIVFTVILKSAIDWIYGVLGLLALSFALMFAIKAYKKARLKNEITDDKGDSDVGQTTGNRENDQ